MTRRRACGVSLHYACIGFASSPRSAPVLYLASRRLACSRLRTNQLRGLLRDADLFSHRFPAPRASPLVWFFLLTQFAMPPAQNTVVMFQLRDDPKAAKRQATTLLAVYAAAVVPLAFLFNAYLTACGLSV